MMKISSSGKYVPGYAPVTFRVEGADPREIVEAGIYDQQGRLLGIKNFSGLDVYEVNISRYLNRLVDVIPREADRTGFGRPAGRCAGGYITVGDEVSEVSFATAGIIRCDVPSITTDAPGVLKVCCGDHGEVSLLTDGQVVSAEVKVAAQAEETGYTYEAGICEGPVSFFYNIPELIGAAGIDGQDNLVTVTVKIFFDGVESGGVILEVDPEWYDSVRVCWLNRMGGLDFYNFRTLVSEEIGTRAERFYSGAGYVRLGAESETGFRVVSRRESEEVIRWLSSIAGSPRVWMSAGDKWQRIEVTGTKAVVVGGEPVVELEWVKDKKTHYQNL